ncbi:MAG: pilus assembly protein PilZ [Hyphomicrobiales bacterium]|jgi:hypothetical protein|nr:pilus assembly protein PilZ [Hyphomicrobiales bacterium]
MPERRQDARRRAYLGARVVVDRGFQTFECLVLNLSDAGAELHTTAVQMLPDTFMLEVPRKGRSFKARVCWRKEDWIGVEFLESAVLAQGGDQSLQPVALRNR